MGDANVWNSHPKTYGPGSRTCRVCGNSHGLIRKYGFMKQKQKTDEAAKKLQDEIQYIKAQKVQLQHRIKQEAEQFRQWKASREKELLQTSKERRAEE